MNKDRRNIKIISKDSHFLDKPAKGKPWVLRSALEHWHKDYYYNRPANGTCLLAYIQDGIISVGGDKKDFKAGAGDIIYLADEKKSREIKVLSAQGTKLIILVLRGTNSKKLSANYLGRKAAVLKTADAACIEPLFYSIFKSAKKGYSSSSNIAANLLEPLLQTISQEYLRADNKKDPEMVMFNKCREFMTHNYLTIESVSDIAEKFSITHSKLCSLFKAYEKNTPHKFLLQRKMTHAVYELHQQECTVSEIAGQLGFADQYSFSKTFKRVMGYCPSEAK
ncbi:MAG: helix-turn-helix domain-containing protein [Planctomycetota bacterium]|jgi:AraC-like DNA-binding protein